MSFSAAKETALELFIGEDWLYEFDITNEAEDTAIDITGWALSFMVKRKQLDLDAAALLTKTTAEAAEILIEGAFNATPDDNAQRAKVTLDAIDSDDLSAGTRWWELKRTDAGFEKVLAYGPVTLRRGVIRA